MWTVPRVYAAPISLPVRQDRPKLRLRAIPLNTRVDAPTAVALFAILAAFVLRMYRLGFRALIGDEAFSALNSAGSLEKLAALYYTVEATPPLHYLLLFAWQRLIGSSEYALRFPSAAFGVLTVAMVYVMGRRLVSAPAGALAAIFVAASPYLIAQSQIARSYSMAIAAGALAALTLLLVLDRPSRSRWLIYIGASALAIYTHTVMVLATAGLAVGYVVLPSAVRDRITVGRWLLAHTVIGILFLPWIVRSAMLIANPASVWFEEGDAFELIQRMLQSFALGNRPISALGDLTIVAMVCLATVGIVGGWRWDSGDKPNRLIALWLLVPLLLVLAISLRVPITRDRYLIGAFIPFVLAIAWGLQVLGMRMSRMMGGFASNRLRLLGLFAGLVLLVAPAAVALPDYYRKAEFIHAVTIRELQSTIKTTAGPNLAVVLNFDSADPLFKYYDLSPARIVWVPNASGERRLEGERTLDELLHQPVLIWLVTYPYGPSEARYVIPFLDSHAYRLEHRWYDSLRLIRYFSPADQNTLWQAVDATFTGRESAIVLQEYRIRPTETMGGGAIAVDLVWRADVAPNERLKIFVHLADESGSVVAQNDAEPQQGQAPTNSWQAGQTILDRYALAIPAHAAAGNYYLNVGLYRPEDGWRSELPDGTNAIQLGPIVVERPNG